MIDKSKKVRDFKRRVSYFNNKILLTKQIRSQRDKLSVTKKLRVELVSFLKLHENDSELKAMDRRLYLKMKNGIMHLIYKSQERL